jgi:hypothetical protein
MKKLLGLFALFSFALAHATPVFILQTQRTSSQGTQSTQTCTMPPGCGQVGITFVTSMYSSNHKFGLDPQGPLVYNINNCSMTITSVQAFAGRDSIVLEKVRNGNPTDTHYIYRWTAMGGVPPQGFRTGFYFQKGVPIGAALQAAFATQTWVNPMPRGNWFTFEYEGAKPSDTAIYTSISGVNYVRWTNGKIWVWEVGSASNTNFDNVVRSIWLTVNTMDTSIHWVKATCNGYIVRAPVTWDKASYNTTSVDQVATLDNQFRIYPNPVTDYMNVLTYSEGVLKVRTLEGKEVVCQKLEETTIQLDLRSLPAGCYLVSFNDLSTRKFIKQ